MISAAISSGVRGDNPASGSFVYIYGYLLAAVSYIAHPDPHMTQINDAPGAIHES
jgi:hypothetical protein